LIGFMITTGDIVCVFDSFHRYDKNR
jgi:hypothetical protein